MLIPSVEDDLNKYASVQRQCFVLKKTGQGPSWGGFYLFSFLNGFLRENMRLVELFCCFLRKGLTVGRFQLTDPLIQKY